MTVDKEVDLTAAEMLEYRTRALTAAVHAHGTKSAAEIAHSAGVYLGFLLQGEPVNPIGTLVTTEGKPPLAPQPAPAQAAVAEAAKAAVVKPKKTPPAAAVVQPAAAAPAAKPATIAAPATMTEAVASFKALVSNKANDGRNKAIALLTEFGVTQLGQVDAAKLAEFKRRCDAANAGDTGAGLTDPTGGLL